MLKNVLKTFLFVNLFPVVTNNGFLMSGMFEDVKHLLNQFVESLRILNGSRSNTQRPVCSLLTAYNSPDSYIKDGDIIIGGLLQIFVSSQLRNYYDPFPSTIQDKCSGVNFGYVRHLLAFMFAVEEINNRTDLLPNVTLGFHIYDTCDGEHKAVHSVLNTLSGSRVPVPNYDCHKKSKVVGFIGHRTTSSSLASAALTGVYRYPQISYGAMSPVFDNRFRFPSFYRTVPDEREQLKAIVLLLKHFGWNWVGIVSFDHEDSEKFIAELRSLLLQNQICAEFAISIDFDLNQCRDLKCKPYGTISVIAQSTCKVVIFYSSSIKPGMSYLFGSTPFLKKIIIFYGMLRINDRFIFKHSVHGSFLVDLPRGEIPGLKDYLLSADPEKYPNNTVLLDVFTQTFKCAPEALRKISSFKPPPCRDNHSLHSADPSKYDVENFRLTFRVYAAVYALAHALHETHPQRKEAINETESQYWPLRQINKYLRRGHITTSGGEAIRLGEGSHQAKFDLLNVIITPKGSMSLNPVGYFHHDGREMSLQIDTKAIQWNPKFTQNPQSLCSARCQLGYYKAQQGERHSCCYYCVPCPENEITNTTASLTLLSLTVSSQQRICRSSGIQRIWVISNDIAMRVINDMERCYKCPEDHWSNERRDTCIPRPTEFLSFSEILGSSLAVIALFFCFGTLIIFGIFIKHKNTPVVKANNQTLSFLLLLSLMVSFLCSLLFIGRPTKMSCLLRQTVFTITFSAAVSSVLAKTVTVVLAFRATHRPHSGLLWRHFSVTLVVICTLGEVLICATWLIISPPFPYYDTHVEIRKMVLQCNEGSTTTFYIAIGYVGGLAMLSFIVAFLARKLPDTFNEAQYITFSMLVFCSVWISFIPAYLSTKGKYMVAVEVFSILASSAGLLGCIFIPKCYIILLRPELNVKRTVTQRQAFK